MRYSFVIDQSRCIGCHACSLACKSEHDVPLGSYRTWVKYVEKGAFPDVRRTFSVLRCNHCELAPCVEICPVTALYRRDDGIVDFDRDVCIGCKGCMQACPYDALYIHPERGTAEKCNFCSHRIEIDLEPPCATVCPTEAILVGDIDDASSRVAQVIATRKVSVRKPEKGTMPKVFYVDGEPQALTPGASSPTGGYLWADGPTRAASDWSTGSRGALAEVDSNGSVGFDASRQQPAETTSDVLLASPFDEPNDPADSPLTTPEGWINTDLPPAAAQQLAGAARASEDLEFFSGAWATLTPSRTTYDVAHETPWGWKVSAYLWTKSIAAGAFLVALLAPYLGLPRSPTLDIGAPLTGLVFLAITSALLVVDLKRPERFWMILTRPNWNSWIARGAYIITGFAVLATLWSAAALLKVVIPASGATAELALALLRWPLAAFAVATAGYSGYLFAQAKGRDYWQNSATPLHLSAQAALAGLAAAMPLLTIAGASVRPLLGWFVTAMALHLVLIGFGEATVAHVSHDGRLAVKALLKGRLRGWFWWSIAFVLAAVGVAVATELGSGPAALASGLLALTGLALYEHAWVQAGQCVPLS